MLESVQFLHIMAAEAAHHITVSIYVPAEHKSMFEHKLNAEFTSDSFSDTAKAWNEERSSILQETLGQHLIPIGVKWTRREKIEDYLATRCSQLRAVR
jgi:transcription elongation factor SPT6